MKKTWITIGIVIIVALTIVLVVTQTKSGLKVVKIGALFSLTGDAASYGERSVEGMNIALAEINDKGGIDGKKLDIILEDDKSNGKDAVSALLKLATVNKVKVVIGPCASSLALDSAPVANKNKVVLFATTISADKYSTPDDFTFRNWPSAKLIASKLAEVAYNKLGLKKFVIIYLNNDMGKSYESGFKEAFLKIGGGIVDSEAYSPDVYDFRTQLIKVKVAKPDALFLVGHTEIGYVLKQMKELGISLKVISEIGIEDPKVKEIAGDLVNGIIYATASYNSKSEIPLVKEYELRYFEKYGRHSDIFAASAYDAVRIVAKAIKEAGYNCEAIRDYLFKMKDFPGVTGNISFDRNGDVIKEVAIKKVIDGEYRFLDENLKPMR